ncbi:hypothetical protein BsWGS_24786 [Bradybaena similaris]
MDAASAFVVREAAEKAVLEIKVSLLGDSSVGKTSITSSFHDVPMDIEPKTTICFEFSTKLVNYGNGSKVRYAIYDTAGQEKFRGIMPNFVRNMDAVVVVYDITNKESFKNVDKWLHFVNNHLPYDIPVIIVGNKLDIAQRRQVTEQEGKTKAELSNSFFLETSAMTGERVAAIFEELSTTIREKKINELFHGARIPLKEMAVRLSPNSLTEERRSCC